MIIYLGSLVAIIGAMIYGGGVFLAALSMLALVALGEWSKSVKPIDRTTFNLLLLTGVVYLAELFVTRGLTSSALLGPSLIILLLFIWNFFHDRENLLAKVGEAATIFLVIPYALGFLLLLRDLPAYNGVWILLGVIGIALTILLVSWYNRQDQMPRWLWAMSSMVLSGLTGWIFFKQVDLVGVNLTNLIFIITLASTVGLGSALVGKMLVNNKQSWLIGLLTVNFMSPIVYLWVTLVY